MKQKIIPLLKQYLSYFRIDEIYDHATELAMARIKHQIIDLIENKNFDENELTEEYRLGNVKDLYTPLMEMIEIKSSFPNRNKDFENEVISKLLDSNLGRLEYVSPRQNTALYTAIDRRQVELAIEIINRTDSKFLINQKRDGLNALDIAFEQYFFRYKGELMEPVVLKLLDKMTYNDISQHIKILLTHGDIIDHNSRFYKKIRELFEQKNAKFNIDTLLKKSKKHLHVPEDMLETFKGYFGGKEKRKYKTYKSKTNKRTSRRNKRGKTHKRK
jgi:hypothetical protein